MKNKTHFRIICLRNEEGRNGRDCNQKKYNVLMAGIRGTSEEKEVPNVVHLSARLQDDVYQGQRIRTLSGMQDKEESQDQEAAQRMARQRMQKQRQQQISSFLQTRQQALNKDQNTIKNLIGPINFSSIRRKQKRAASHLKFTMKNASASARCINQKEDVDIAVVNRDLLESDFHTFLMQKDRQKERQPTNEEDREGEKLKRLSVINPEDSSEALPSTPQPLNLFHFLARSNLAQKLRNRSPSTALSYRSKIDKKMFNLQPSSKPEQFQFQWSRLKSKQKNFTFKAS